MLPCAAGAAHFELNRAFLYATVLLVVWALEVFGSKVLNGIKRRQELPKNFITFLVSFCCKQCIVGWLWGNKWELSCAWVITETVIYSGSHKQLHNLGKVILKSSSCLRFFYLQNDDAGVFPPAACSALALRMADLFEISVHANFSYKTSARLFIDNAVLWSYGNCTVFLQLALQYVSVARELVLLSNTVTSATVKTLDFILQTMHRYFLYQFYYLDKNCLLFVSHFNLLFYFPGNIWGQWDLQQCISRNLG